MREIKFRQPIKGILGEFCSYHYWGYIGGEFIPPLPVIFQDDIGDSEQYIGHRDKIGKEIYEGAIARVEHPDKSVPLYDLHSTKFRVEYAYGIFVLKSDNYVLHPARHFAWGEIEVIGNIYENPELMEEK